MKNSTPDEIIAFLNAPGNEAIRAVMRTLAGALAKANCDCGECEFDMDAADDLIVNAVWIAYEVDAEQKAGLAISRSESEVVH